MTSLNLSPEELEKIRRIHVRSRMVVDTLLGGEYRSAFRGQGMEFEEVREYSPGDEIKHIDWNVTARAGRPYVKLYREERELSLMLLVDMSASGLFGSAGTAKRQKILECAGALGFAAISARDRVGALLFSDRVENYLPPRRGASAVWDLIRHVTTFKPSRKGTDLTEALTYLGRVHPKRSVVFLISDFLSSGCEGALKVASRRHDLIGIHITDPADGRLPQGGIVTLQDLESNAFFEADAGDPKVRRFYEERHRKRQEHICRVLHRSGVDRLEMSTTDSVGDVLLRFFSLRERRRVS